MSKADLRDALIAELQGHLAEMAGQFEEYRANSERLLAVEIENARLTGQNEVLATVLPIGEHLGAVADGMEALEAKVRTLPRTQQGGVEDALARLQDQMTSLSQVVQMSLDGGPVRPLLSEALQEWFGVRNGFGIDPKKVTTDRNRILDFIAFAGDKPANKYSYFDIQRFMNLLVRVPGNYSKIPHLKGKPRQDAADYNDRLPDDKRLPTLSVKSIEDNYLSPLRVLFRDVGAQHGFRSPLTDVEIRISADATPSVERVPFDVPELNLWFAHAAKEVRADMKWLPLLGSITGARIAELIFLQGKDIYRTKGNDGLVCWVLDLRTELIAEGGGTQKRKTKNKPSRRLIALHKAFEAVGFIKYAQSRRDDEWLFPAAFYYGKRRVQDPADAASKRMNRMLVDVGIHKRLEKVFHSSRHTAKDIMRMARVDERTHDLQTGHALATVSQRYGLKHLAQQELEVLRSLPLPDGLDLTPYMNEDAPSS